MQIEEGSTEGGKLRHLRLVGCSTEEGATLDLNCCGHAKHHFGRRYHVMAEY